MAAPLYANKTLKLTTVTGETHELQASGTIADHLRAIGLNTSDSIVAKVHYLDKEVRLA